MGGAETFEEFFGEAEPLLRRALVARYRAELGREAVAEGFAVAWRLWERVAVMENRAGYVYRTAERWAARQNRRPTSPLFAAPRIEDRYVDQDLVGALELLSPRQRQAVVLVEGFGLTHRETAQLLGCSRSSIQNHVERGMARLRTNLEVIDNV